MARGKNTWLDDIWRGMPLSPFGKTHGRMTSGVTYHLCPYTAHIVGRHRAWHVMITHGKHTRSDNVECGMLSWFLDSTHSRTTSAVAGCRRPWEAYTGSDNVGLGMPSSTLESIHGRTMSGMAYYHRQWTTHTIGLRRVGKFYNGLWEAHIVSQHRPLNVIIALGRHTRSDYIGCGMLSSPLEIIHD
uniref:Uncharacterized protein n=1 Tax=Solanum lycopersicum TaxID=4081 RepID=A0A494G8H5_SOLLC